MRLRLFVLLLALLAAGLTACAGGGGSVASPISADHPMRGQQVSFSLPSDRGLLVTVPPPDGRVTVLDFWAPSCEPCRQAVPALVARKAAIEAKGARLVLVGVLGEQESTDDGRAVLASWGVDQPFLVDRSDASKAQLAVIKLPATLIVDGAGTLVWAAPKGATADQVVAAIP